MLAGEAEGGCEWDWFHTSTLLDDPSEQLADFHGVWCVPAGPYANTGGALASIRLARRTGRPFLGTCGGFQHALLEYAEGVWGVARPAHAELDPLAADPVIAPLACGLVEQSAEIRFEKGSRLAAIYGVEAVTEGYHCRYGLRSGYSDRLASGPLHVVDETLQAMFARSSLTGIRSLSRPCSILSDRGWSVASIRL